VTIVLTLALSLVAPVAAHAAATSGPKMDVPAATIVTADGVVLWSKNPNDKRRVASTMKMLNALVVRDHAKLDEVVTVTKKRLRADVWA